MTKQHFYIINEGKNAVTLSRTEALPSSQYSAALLIKKTMYESSLPGYCNSTFLIYPIYFHCSVLGATIYTPLSFTTCFGCTQPSSGNDVSLDRHTVLNLLGSIKISVF
jgi:hypothetical protein